MPPVFLGPADSFPDPRQADADGMVAFGGDLSVPRLLAAYRAGVFPWSVNPVTWWSPDPRGIIPWDNLHVSRSLKRVLRQNLFRVTANTAFRPVMEACAEPGPGRRTTWITPEFIDAYEQLHLAGHAHSLEVWRGAELVGGIYGVSVGGLFAGESMFHRVSNASKVALVCLMERLRERGYLLFDVQMITPIVRQMGGVEITRDEYLCRLARALRHECSLVWTG